MAKSTSLLIRIDPEFKGRLEEAARSKGLTVSTIVTQALEHAVGRIEDRAGKPQRNFRGIPASFKAACAEASRGGWRGFANAGRQLARHAPGMLEPQDDTPAIEKKLANLRTMLRKDDGIGVLEWFDREFPACMEMIPTRRRVTFLLGIRQAHDEDDFTQNL